jgi:DNA-binding winged helix-turn-helix (wHTH) protein
MLLSIENIDTGSAPFGTARLPRFLAIGAHVVDVDTLRVATRPEAGRLTPKSIAVLLRLANAGGRTLSRDDLLNEVWKGTCPTPDVVTQAIADLRRAFGDDAHAPRYIETLPRIGYRLIAPARFVDSPAEAAHAPAPSRPRRERWLRAMPFVLAVLSLALSAAALMFQRVAHSSTLVPCEPAAQRVSAAAHPARTAAVAEACA